MHIEMRLKTDCIQKKFLLRTETVISVLHIKIFTVKLSSSQITAQISEIHKFYKQHFAEFILNPNIPGILTELTEYKK